MIRPTVALEEPVGSHKASLGGSVLPACRVSFGMSIHLMNVRQVFHASLHSVIMSAVVQERVNGKTDLHHAASSGISDPTRPGDPKTQTKQLRSAEEIGAYALIQNPVLNRGTRLTSQRWHTCKTLICRSRPDPANSSFDVEHVPPGTAFTAAEREEKQCAHSLG